MIYIILPFFFLLGCVHYSHTENQGKSNLSYGYAKKKIVKGVTTQDEIIKDFGAPNITTQNKRGEEIWTYNRQSFHSESSNFGAGIFFVFGSKAVSESSSKTFDLIITFNKNNTVKTYSIVASQF